MPLNLNRKLTPKQTAVISACAVAAALLGYLGYQLVEPKIIAAQARALLPRICAGILEQRAVILNAIDAYKKEYGSCPPDHVVSLQPLVADPVNNSLAYELAGVVYDPTNKRFHLGPAEPAEAAYVTNFFHSQGFRNSAQSERLLKHFLPADKLTLQLLHDDPDVFALGYQPTWKALDPAVLALLEFSTWRYVASAPTNNPGRFDLWIDFKVGGKKMTLGNWAAVE